MKKEYLVSAKEMKQLDDNTINRTGILSPVLMERAALSVAECVKHYLGENKEARILVVAGNGNNGADGICAGRILTEYGYHADICLLHSEREYTQELLRQRKIAEVYGISFVAEDTDLAKYSVIIDAIFGVGLNRDVKGPAADMIKRINASDAYVISVDIPSGINATTGEVCAVAVEADETVTFGFYKCGQIFYPGREWSGRVTKACIGIDETSFYGQIPQMFTYMGCTDKPVDFNRNAAGNKGTFGKVLVVAGRDSTAGAALLCATSALRSGCGMVAVFTQEANKEVFLTNRPEIMVETFTDSMEEAVLFAKLDSWLSWADVCVIGCGLGKDATAERLLFRVADTFEGPVIADADALHILACDENFKNTVSDRKTNGKAPLILTPHAKELSVLAHRSIADVKKNRMEIAEKVCEEYGSILVAKDADTLCMEAGEPVYLNSSGNDGMSTAGSGDVLAGLIGSVVAQKMRCDEKSFEAVCLAVYIHGLAGDYQAKKNGNSFLVASDMIEAYKYIMK